MAVKCTDCNADFQASECAMLTGNDTEVNCAWTSTSNTLFKKCLPATFKATCPKGGDKIRVPYGGSSSYRELKFPDFDASQAKCRFCEAAITVDKNTLPDEYYYVLTFGDLFDDSRALVDFGMGAYYVYNVSKEGRPVASVARVTRTSVPSDKTACCVPMKYTVKLKGTFPSGYDGMSRYCIGAADTSTMPKLTPCLWYTDKLVDVKYGKTKKYTGAVTLTLSAAHVDNLVGNSEAKEIFAKSFAATLNLDAADVAITAIRTRAVGATDWTVHTFNNRRLGSHSATDKEVKVDYEVITTKSGFTMSADSFTSTANLATLKTQVQKKALDAGVTVTVKSAAADEPSGGEVGTVKATTGGASTAFFPLVATILAVGAHLMF